MQRISEITSRIQAIQARVERPDLPGAFGAVLQAAVAREGAPPTEGDGHSHGEHAGPAPAAAALDVKVFNARTGLTLGSMLGAIGPIGQAGQVGGVTGPYRTHHVADGVIMSSAELDEYMTVNGIEARNGRLGGHELSAISGSWHGNGKLLPPAAEAWELMRSAAAEDGIDLRAIDTYRTWESQERAHHKHLSGEKTANVLPPGTSRHGAGLAIDVTNGHIIHRNDPEWHWLKANAASFGWHPISNESWHWEFRGV